MLACAEAEGRSKCWPVQKPRDEVVYTMVGESRGGGGNMIGGASHTVYQGQHWEVLLVQPAHRRRLAPSATADDMPSARVWTRWDSL